MDTLSKDSPIGIFDSGIGGLTVANAVIRHLPNEKIIYFGDTAHLPYGDKSADAIKYYSLKIAHFLLEQNCKMIIIACNSASTAAYKDLLSFFKKKALFINVVDPLIDKVIDEKYNKVGVIATKATINSHVYENNIQKKRPSVDTVSLATPLLAPMIEEGFLNNKISKSIISSYLNYPDFNNIDALLLACTHYPLIKKEIKEFLGEVDVFDSTDVTAIRAFEMLQKHNLLRESKNPIKHQFYVSDYTTSFEETAKFFFKGDINLKVHSIW